MPYCQVEALGKCEKCGQIINIQDYAGADMDAVWLCKHCKEPVEGASFGYGSDNKKSRWIGPGGVWQDARPTEDFELEGTTVFVRANYPT